MKILIQHTGAGGRRTQYATPCKYTNLNVSCFNNNSAVCKVRVCYLVRVVNHQSILVLSRVRHPSCNADEHKTTMFTQLCVLQNAHHTRPKVLGSLTHICIELYYKQRHEIICWNALRTLLVYENQSGCAERIMGWLIITLSSWFIFEAL